MVLLVIVPLDSKVHIVNSRAGPSQNALWNAGAMVVVAIVSLAFNRHKKS